MGGIGKTTLAIQLGKLVQTEFDYLIWRSLRNAPPLNELLTDILGIFKQENNQEENIKQSISELMKCLRQNRCLLILDSFETILSSGDRAGHYRQDYELYGELITKISDISHQSCVILTSREKPKEVIYNERRGNKVKALNLKGISLAATYKIFNNIGLFFGEQQHWEQISNSYSGNPLALKIIASIIANLFNGNLRDFCDLHNQGMLVFDDIHDLIEQQFQRLSPQQKEIMYWSAITREEISYEQLSTMLLDPVACKALPKNLESLRRRSLLEKSANKFYLQSVVTEYLTEKFIDNFFEEIIAEKFELLSSYSIIDAQTKDYIFDTQIRLIANPLIEKLQVYFKTNQKLIEHLIHLVNVLRHSVYKDLGYAGGNLINLLGLLKKNLNGINFADLTIRKAYLVSKELQAVNFQNSNLNQSVFSEDFGSMLAIAISPDGNHVAGAGVSQEIQIWANLGSNSILTCKGHRDWVRSIAFSTNSRILASASHDQTIRLWSVQSGECLDVMSDHDGAIWKVVFSPDGTMLASGSEDQTIRIWDFKNKRCQKILSGHEDTICSLDFTPDGFHLISSSKDGNIRIWNIAQGKCVKTLEGHFDAVWCVKISPDGQTIASGSEDCTVRLWNFESGNCLAVLEGHERCIWSLDFSPDGQFLVSGGHDIVMRWWSISTHKCLKILPGHTNYIWSVAFHPNGQFLVSGGHDQTVRWWEIPSGKLLRTLQGYSYGSDVAVINRQGNLLLSGHRDHKLRLWDLSDNKLLQVYQGHNGWIKAVAFDSREKLVASASEDLSIRLWDTMKGELVSTLLGHQCWIWSVVFSGDGQIIASGSEDRTIKLWSVEEGRCIRTLKGHKHSVRLLTYNSQHHYLASASSDQTIRFWNVQTGNCLNVFKTEVTSAIAFSPDGKWFVYGNEDGLITVIDCSTGQKMTVLKEHQNKVLSISFSYDSQTFSSLSQDQKVIIWTIDRNSTFKLSRSMTDQRASSVAFNSMGQPLIISNGTHSLEVLSLENNSSLHRVEISKPYEGMNITNIKGVSRSQLRKIIMLGADENLPLRLSST